MDSRLKITTAAGAARRLKALGPCTVASGTFDPLLAQHARRLESVRQAGTPLAVIVEDPTQQILSASARAELVAALRAVELVILPDGTTTLPSPDFRFEEQDEADCAAFVQHVRESQT